MKTRNYVVNKHQKNTKVINEDINEKGINPDDVKKYKDILELIGESYTDEQVLKAYSFLKGMAVLFISVYIKNDYETSNFNGEG